MLIIGGVTHNQSSVDLSAAILHQTGIAEVDTGSLIMFAQAVTVLGNPFLAAIMLFLAAAVQPLVRHVSETSELARQRGIDLQNLAQLNEYIIQNLREAEVLLAQGKTIAQVCRKVGITDQTYYRWRKEYGGIRTDQAKRLKDLEKENARLKRLLAEAELDKAAMKEVIEGKW